MRADTFMCQPIVTCLRKSALCIVRLQPRANVPAQRTLRTNTFVAVRGDKMAMRPFAKLLWTFVRLIMRQRPCRTLMVGLCWLHWGSIQHCPDLLARFKWKKKKRRLGEKRRIGREGNSQCYWWINASGNKLPSLVWQLSISYCVVHVIVFMENKCADSIVRVSIDHARLPTPSLYIRSWNGNVRL